MKSTEKFLLIVVVFIFVCIFPSTASVPVPQFTGTPRSGTAPLIVTFTDQSLGNPAGWAWYFGDENFTEPWTLVNASAGWSTRNGITSVVMPDGSIVLMGGLDGSYYNDVWRSGDNGTTWMQMNASAGWSGRLWHTSVVMPDGSIILMGGMGNGGSLNNDTWRSMDKGAIWTQMNESSGWSARYGTSSIAMPDSSIVLIGGSIGFGSNKKDVWRSTDNGTTWDEVNASVGWSARYQHSIVTLPDGSIVLMGGSSDSGYKNDVWRSTDNGTTWEEVNASAGWLGREGHRCVAMPDGSIVLTGGYSGSRENDVWRSTDNGATWKEANVSAGWSGRAGHGIVTIPDGSIVLMGGCDNTECARNDVWRMNPVGSSAQNPTHVYTTPGTYQVTLQVYNAIGFNSTRKTGYITVTNVSKIGVFRNSTHLFYLDQNGNGVWNGVLVDRANNFGISGDIPISGDWNTDRKTEIGVFRPSTHLFYLDYNGNGVWNGAAVDRQYNFGLTGDMPVSGDWNTDGKYEIGVFRNSTHLFYLDYNGNGAWNGASVDKQYNFGITGDIP